MKKKLQKKDTNSGPILKQNDGEQITSFSQELVLKESRSEVYKCLRDSVLSRMSPERSLSYEDVTLLYSNSTGCVQRMSLYCTPIPQVVFRGRHYTLCYKDVTVLYSHPTGCFLRTSLYSVLKGCHCTVLSFHRLCS